MPKIGQNVNKAVYFFARFFRVNLVVFFTETSACVASPSNIIHVQKESINP